MRKMIMSFCTILLVFLLVSCKQSETSDHVKVDIGQSTKFTKTEITKAVDSVKNNFDFPACTLTKIWYDEEKSNSFAASYIENGNGSVNGVSLENVIVLLSNFDVDDSGDNPVLNRNSTYTDYKWILIRDNKTSDWKIDAWGY